MKQAIVNFFNQIKGLNEVYDEYLKEMREIKGEVSEFIGVLLKGYNEFGLKETWEFLKIGRENLANLVNLESFIQILTELGRQVAESVEKFAIAFSKKENIKVFEDLADQMLKENIIDMKQIVWNTTNEEKLTNFEDWKNNFSYKELGTLDLSNEAVKKK